MAGSPNPAYMYNWAAQNVLQSPTAPPTPRSWSDRRKEQFEPLDAKTTKKIANVAMSVEDGSSAGSSIFRTLSTHRRRVSIGSLLSLPAFSARGKQIKQRLIGGGSPALPPTRPRIVKRSRERVPLEDVAAFRCDIYAQHSSDHFAAEAECKQMVREAGGEIVDDFLYPGGFLYDMTNAADYNPLDDGDQTVDGGFIRVTPWIRFKPAQFNPLRMHPVNVPSMLSPLTTWDPLPSTPTRPRPRDEARIANREQGSIWTAEFGCSPQLTRGDKNKERVGSWVEDVEYHSPFKSVSKTTTSAVTENNSHHTKSLPELDFLSHGPSTLSTLPNIDVTDDGSDHIDNVPDLDFRNDDDSASSQGSSDTGKSKSAESEEDFKSIDGGEEPRRAQIGDGPGFPMSPVQASGLRESGLEETPRATSKESLTLSWLKKKKRSASLGTRSLKSVSSSKSAEQQWTAYAMPNFG